MTETNSSTVPAEPKKSDAASRILRAVEKSRGDTTARLEIPTQVLTAASSASSMPASDLPKLIMPKIGVDAREALRSLSERQRISAAAEDRIPAATEARESQPVAPKPEDILSEAPSQQPRTVSEILRATKPAVTSPLPGETRVEGPLNEGKPAESDVPRRQETPKKGHKSGKMRKFAATANTQASTVSESAAEVPETQASTPAPDQQLPAESASRSNGRARLAGPAFEAPTLGMGPDPNHSFWANLPLVVKAGMAVLLLGGIAGILFKFSGSDQKGASKPHAVKSAPVLAPMSGIGGWTPNWGDPSKMQGRSISLFRPSLQHADYRIEFDAQIETKAFGWVFRAKDPQNYYGYKIETVKPGLQPLVALARITVVSGVESQKHYTLLESPVRPDTVFHVRMDSFGSEFTTRINEQLVEVWQDDRLRFGGVGLFSDPGERAQIRKVQIFEMR